MTARDIYKYDFRKKEGRRDGPSLAGHAVVKPYFEGTGPSGTAFIFPMMELIVQAFYDGLPGHIAID